jgi:hypothetical protein
MPGNALGIDMSGLPVVGGMFPNKHAEALEAQFRKMMETYQQLREPMQQAQMNALGQQLSVFGPVNDQIGRMYGQGSMFDTAPLLQNPIPAGTSEIGAPPGKPTSEDFRKRGLIGSGRL